MMRMARWYVAAARNDNSVRAGCSQPARTLSIAK
jgi:hypothetical protein